MRCGLRSAGVVLILAAMSVAHAHAGDAGSLNGTMALSALTGGVGNTQGTHCCGQGGFVVVIGGTGPADADGAIGLRQARDRSFGQSFGGAVTDRSFRFRANSVQRSGF